MKLTAGEWDELRSKRADINDLVIARIVGDHVEPGAPLQEGMEKIEDIRLSPWVRRCARRCRHSTGPETWRGEPRLNAEHRRDRILPRTSLTETPWFGASKKPR